MPDTLTDARITPALQPGCSILVIAAHPDDETIGAGARLAGTPDAVVVQATDGAPRNGPDVRNAGCASWQDYAALRRHELARAMALAGLPMERVIGLGYPDQGASPGMAGLAREIEALLTALRPRLVLTHPYEGGHPDHDAVAFAVHAALMLARRSGAAPPHVEEMASYHAAEDGTTRFQAFLNRADAPERTIVLSPDGRALKRRMIDAYASQATTLAPFRDDVERFRPAPVYDFTRPPHPGPLNYDRFAWGMTSLRWRTCATEALHALGLEDTAWR
ncbi:PIG-L deacetylase family protein [Arenibaculum pallidiluteum]|uniref:PIG-L deacetylase family protein n=1 Tax=Arenibaculum pallidiluteum TaxID=2812559 RepID=UPI001A95893D|nr:PIG-L family deacetylase [Arenibaculum pallidiluteum]